MNNLENIIKLLNAGYTKEDIDVLTDPYAKGETVEAEEVEKEKEEATEVKEVKEDTTKAILDRLDSLEKLLHKNAILTDSTDGAQKETAKDILASIINPYIDNE